MLILTVCLTANQVRYRVEWAKFQERERKKEEEEREKERVAYAQIDWHDFVVVETVDFQPNEQGKMTSTGSVFVFSWLWKDSHFNSLCFVCSGHFPPPTTPEELGARILIQERYEKFGESEEVEMEVESEDEDDERQERNHGQHSQPDQDTQVQDMDEVRAKEIPWRRFPQTVRALNYNLPSFSQRTSLSSGIRWGWWWHEGSTATGQPNATPTSTHTWSGYHSQGLRP